MTAWRPQYRLFLGGVNTRDWAWFVALFMEAFGNGLVSSGCGPTVSACERGECNKPDPFLHLVYPWTRQLSPIPPHQHHRGLKGIISDDLF